MIKIDTWLGKNVFFPPIIKLCQITGQSQYQIHDYATILGSLIYVLAAWQAGMALWGKLLVVLIHALLITFTLHRFGTWKRAHPIGRVVVWCLFILQVPNVIALGAFLWVCAEYALCIKTIPPVETKTRRVFA